MLSYYDVTMLSGKTGYTIRYTYNGNFWFYTVMSKYEARADICLLMVYAID